MGDSTSASPRLLLRGTVNGDERVFILEPGANRIGSARDAEIRLPSRGVSRHHALIHARADGCTLEDLESKNGVRVNGHQVTRAELAAGDEVRIAGINLTLVQSDRADVELAIEFPAAEVDATTYSTAPTPGLGADDEVARLLDGLLKRLALAPDPDIDGALAFLVACQRVDGACLLQWQGASRAAVVAAAGKIPRLGTADDLWRHAIQSPDPALRYVRTEEARGASLEQTGGVTLGLLMFGGGSEPGVLSATWLGVILRLFDRLRPRRPQSLPAPSEPAQTELRVPPGIVQGTSPAMTSVYRQLHALRDNDLPVLILGETGVGKEHLALTLHASSPRRKGPFAAVNCSAIPAELLEAEMFGIGKGVATGVEARRGRFQEAEGGVLFLDEIGEMPIELQPKLLRALEERVITPVGLRPVAVDVRIVAATNADLEEKMATGRLRSDLYYRLAGYTLKVPPLRRRDEDLPALVGHFIRRFSEENSRQVRGITVKALRRLMAYPWPGNVRELQHILRRLVCLCPDGQAIDSSRVAEALDRSSVALLTDFSTGTVSLEEQLRAVERRLVRQALVETRGNQSRAARLLEISRNGLAKRLKRLGIDPRSSAFN